MDIIINHPHDLFVKEVLSNKENAKDFFSSCLPDQIKSQVDLSSLEISKDSFVEKELQSYFSDLLYKLKISGQESQAAYLYLLFEHKSSSEAWIALQLLNYYVKIWELHIKQNKEAKILPPILSFVLYHGKDKWSVGTRLWDLIWPQVEEFRAYVPDFSYLLYNLYPASDDQIKGTTIIRVFLLLLKYIYHPEFPARLPQIFSLLKDFLSQPGQDLSFFESAIRYIFSASDMVSEDELKGIVEKTISKDKDGVIMTVAEKLIQQGVQQGVQQGEINMARTAILNVLTIRFNDIPMSLRVKLEGVSNRTILEDLLRKAVTIVSLAELERQIPIGNPS